MVHHYNASSHSVIDDVEVLIAFDKNDNVIDIFAACEKTHISEFWILTFFYLFKIVQTPETSISSSR